MVALREINSTLQTFLDSREPFDYAHLVKFERPQLPDTNTGKIDTTANKYLHICDGSKDVEFDDGSVDSDGNANGVQNYIANKLISVPNVAEYVKARATEHNIQLDGNILGASYFESSMTITSAGSGLYDLQYNYDIRREGFREGEMIELTGDRTGKFNIVNFRSNNTVRISTVEDTLSTGSSLAVTTSLASEEIINLFQNKNSSDYASFLNREVYIYKAYFDSTGALVPDPILIFKGIINNAKIDDDETGIKVTWSLSSHWGDFAEVKGRITSDDFHRALDASGIPQPNSAVKQVYAFDKGFIHSETSINILATYTVQVEKQEVKSKKGFFGIGAKVKVKKFTVDEDRNTELDFNLASKSIPVHYGVRNMKGAAFFADTLNNNSSDVYVAYMLGEGEMQAIYDVYIEDKSLICNNKADYDTRSTQTDDNTVDIICRGRADKGDVLGGVTSVNPASLINFYVGGEAIPYGIDYNYNYLTSYMPYVTPTDATASTSKGIVHQESIQVTEPQEITIDFFSGEPNQVASSQLVSIAQSNGFKIQNDYWIGDSTAEYWGPNHRVLDTAYVLVNVKIEEGETTIPELEFIAKGKVIECYNYDKSYQHYERESSESADNFLLGDTVDLYDSSDNLINNNVQIIDKWTFVGAGGVVETRFRFSSDPVLGYTDGVPAKTKFYMTDGPNKWTMITFNHEEVSGTVSTEISTTVTSVTNNGGNTRINFTSNPDIPLTTYPINGSVGGGRRDVILRYDLQ